MSPTSSVGPNDPCPCGSTKKYKRCCKLAEGPPRPKWRRLVLGALVAAGAAVLIYGPANRSKGASSSSFVPGPGTRSAAGVAQPAGPVPAGKVWSPEHGHWHTAPGAGSVSGSAVTIQPGGVTPQPEGPVPEGKVWSAEHGHWHNAPPAGSVSGTTPDEPPITIQLGSTP